MKKKEVDLTKAHSDLYKTEPKSHGSRLAYTTAGWATVTQDGTILEVLDGFQGAKQNVLDTFIASGDILSIAELDENQALNPKIIGLTDSDPRNDYSDLKGEIILAPSCSTNTTGNDPLVLTGGLPSQGFVETDEQIYPYISGVSGSPSTTIFSVDSNTIQNHTCEYMFFRVKDLSPSSFVDAGNYVDFRVDNNTNTTMSIDFYIADNTSPDFPVTYAFDGTGTIASNSDVEYYGFNNELISDGITRRTMVMVVWLDYSSIIGGQPNITGDYSIRVEEAN